MKLRTRFAPSPTGQLHVGNVRTALFNALLTAQAGGTFILRIEDTDAERSQRGFESAMLADLAWLGLSWQEGPDVGGPSAPYRQSERGQVYRTYIDKLTAQGRTYPCFCTPAELALNRKVQLAAGQPPRYAGTCAQLTDEQVAMRLAQGLKPALRFRVPAEGVTEFEDLIRGPQRFAHKDIGDFVIRRADGSPAFFFSNALDDALMGISHVLRGEDHLANTPRQLLMLAALGLEAPRYGHLPLVLGQGAAPLSKREGGGSLRELRNDGVLPEALMNYLARLGHTYSSNEFMSWAVLAESFQTIHIGHSPAHYDRQQLEHWQRLAVRSMPAGRVWTWLIGAQPELNARVPADRRDAFIELVKENLSQPLEALAWANILFSDELKPEQAAAAAIQTAGRGLFEQASRCFKQSPPDFRSFAKAVGEATHLSGKDLFAPLRAAITGRLHGPEMDKLWRLLPPASIEQRLQAAMQRFPA